MEENEKIHNVTWTILFPNSTTCQNTLKKLTDEEKKAIFDRFDEVKQYFRKEDQ